MNKEDRTHLLEILEKTVNSLIEKNKISIEDACKLIKWLDKANPVMAIYTERMQEILREWCMNRILENSVTISDSGKRYSILLERDFLKNVKDF